LGKYVLSRERSKIFMSKYGYYLGMTPEQLAALLSGRTADVPGTEDPDEHEETEEYEHEN
jgi:hypothetical protein